MLLVALKNRGRPEPLSNFRLIREISRPDLSQDAVASPGEDRMELGLPAATGMKRHQWQPWFSPRGLPLLQVLCVPQVLCGGD